MNSARESGHTSELIGSISDLHEDISQLENEVSTLRAEFVKKQHEIDAIQIKLDRERTTSSLLDARVDNLETELLQANQNREVIAQQLAETRASEQGLQQELQSVVEERTALANTVDMQAQQINRYKTQVNKMIIMTAKIEELEFELAQKSTAQDNLKCLCEDQKVQMDQLKQQIAKLTNENIEVSCARSVAETDNSRLKEQAKELTNQKLRLESMACGKGEHTGQDNSDLKMLHTDDEVAGQSQRKLSTSGSAAHQVAIDRIRQLEEKLEIVESEKASLQVRGEDWSRNEILRPGEVVVGEMDRLMERFRVSEKIYCRLLKRCGIEIMTLRNRIDSMSTKQS